MPVASWTHAIAPRTRTLAPLMTFLLMPLAAPSLSACSSQAVKEAPEFSGGPVGRAIRMAAAETKMDERALFLAGFTQSNFGTDARHVSGPLPSGEGRTALFGLRAEDLGKERSDDLYGNARALGQKVAGLAKERPPRDTFDWLLLTAESISGRPSENGDDIRQANVRLVLMDLIRVHNAGFSTTVGDESVIVEKAEQDKVIDIRNLDEGRARYLSQFRFNREYGTDSYLPGNPAALAGDKDPNVTPKVELRWCPRSTLLCFEHLRQAENGASHFMLFQGDRGQTEILQMFDLTKDLHWFDGARKDIISLTIVGAAGLEAQSLRANWFDWEDYVGLRQVVRDVLQETIRRFQRQDPEPKLKDPAFLRAQVVENLAWPADEAEAKNGWHFPLPVFWDSELFGELIRQPNAPKRTSLVRVQSPSDGQVIEGTSVSFRIFPDPQSSEVSIYQDRQGATPGQPWDLILKREWEAGKAEFDFSHVFRSQGAAKNQTRAVKVVARKADGSLLGTRIVRFTLKGIKGAGGK